MYVMGIGAASQGYHQYRPEARNSVELKKDKERGASE